MDDDRKLTSLLSLYTNILNDITFYQNQGDSTGVMDIIPIAIIPLLEVFNANEFIISLICLFVPVIQCLNLQRGIQAHTFVAMLRGYAANIENSINNILKDKSFIYNSYLIDKYIASQKVVKSKGMKTSWLMTLLMHISIYIICVMLFMYYNLNLMWWVYIVVGVWYISLLILTIKLCIDFAKKERKRFESKDFASNLK